MKKVSKIVQLPQENIITDIAAIHAIRAKYPNAVSAYVFAVP